MPESMVQIQRWINSTNAGAGARLNIFFFPYTGECTSMFRQWQEYLPADVGTYFVHLPRRKYCISKPLHIQLDVVIQALGRMILPYLNRPFVFFGHSVGALVGFELARALRRQGLPQPAQLFLSSCPAPHQRSSHEAFRTFDVATLALDCPISVFGGIEDSHVRFEDLLAWRMYTNHSFFAHTFPGSHLFLHSTRHMLAVLLRRDLSKLLGDVSAENDYSQSGW